MRMSVSITGSQAAAEAWLTDCLCGLASARIRFVMMHTAIEKDAAKHASLHLPGGKAHDMAEGRDGRVVDRLKRDWIHVAWQWIVCVYLSRIST